MNIPPNPTPESNQAIDSFLTAVNSIAGLIRIDAEGIISYSNQTFLRQVKEAKSLVGKPYGELIDTIEGQPTKAFIQQILEQKQIVRGVFAHTTAKGDKVFLGGAYNPIEGEVFFLAQNVTSRRKRNTEARGKIAAIGRSTGSMEIDQDGKILSANSKILQWLGYSKDELLTLNFFDLINTDWSKSQRYKKDLEEIKKGGFAKGVYKFIDKDESHVFLEGTINSIYDDEGEFLKIVIYLQDVTKRRLKNSEARGKLAAIDQSNGVAEFDIYGKILTANQLFSSWVGYSLEELKLMHHRDLCPKEVTNSLKYTVFWEALRSGNFDKGDYRMIDKAGNLVYLFATYNPILDDEGNLVKIVQYAQNNTASNLTYQALRNLAEQMAEHDLSHRIDTPREKEFSEALNRSLDEVTTALVRIRKASNEVKSSSDSLLSNSQSMKQKANSVDLLVRELKRNQKLQRERSDQMVRSASEIEKAASDTITKAEIISRSAEIGSEKTTTGQERMAELLNHMTDIERVFLDVRATIEELNKQSGEITTAIRFVNDLSSQTNLLALNAEIEASKSNQDSSSGLSAISSEIRRLAETSKVSVNDIAGAMTAIQQGIAKAERQISSMDHQVTSGKRATAGLNVVLSDMDTANKKTNDLGLEVVTVARQQQRETEDLHHVIRSVAMTAQEGNVHMEELDESYQNLYQAFRKMEQTGKGLHTLSDQLKSAVDLFKLKED